MSSQLLAASVLANLNNLGLKQFFVAPGSRSQALAIAANQLETAGLASVKVRIDERSLGFIALGAALKSRQPTAVIVTSGTAVGNLLPAVMEAFHSGVPLVLITADRPEELQGRGANQTTNQVDIFGTFVGESITIEASEKQSDIELAARKINASFLATIANSKPLHLNLRFREPLSDSGPNVDAVEIYPTAAVEVAKLVSTEIDTSVPGVVIAGAGGYGASAFAEAAGWPLFAEPSSAERKGENVIVGYAGLLDSALADQIAQVVVFGKPTLSRPVVKLIRASKVTVVRSKTHGFFDVGSNARAQLDAVTASQKPPGWLQSWQDIDKPAIESFDAAAIAQSIWDVTTKKDSFLLGASKVIRVADKAVSAKELDVFANRGLAGIDGSISTAIGIALNTVGMTRALIGDVTVLHDIGSLNLSGYPDLRLQLIIYNDDGGQIFSGLEVKDSVDTESFEKLFQTPQQFDLKMIAMGFGWDYELVENRAELETQLGQGTKLIEIRS